ncbi:hypothetical protein CRYUN_Cryun09bG0057800 [Craigia yunnanensis]
MDRITMAARLMIVSDLDHTMVDHHDPENMLLLRFNALWESNYLHWEKWDKNIVTEETSKFSELTLQAETEQRPHKVSFYVDKTKAQTLDVKIIYSEWIWIYYHKVWAKDRLFHIYLRSLKLRETHLLILLSVVILEMMLNSSAFQMCMESWSAMPKKNCCNSMLKMQMLESTNPGHEVVKFDMFYERWRRGEIDNCETYIASLKASCDPSAIFVFPSGVEKTLHECIHRMKGCHADQKGKQFQVWVDRVLSTPIGSNTWLVKFDRWELSGDEQYCCVTTVKINAKGCGASDGYDWVNVQQKW